MRFLVLSAALLVSAIGAQAQTARTIYLFNSSLGSAPGAASPTKLGSWGNGTLARTRENVNYEGGDVLELNTRNFVEGGRFDLATPVEIAPYVERGFLRLRLRFSEAAAAPNLGNPEGGPGFGPPDGNPGFGAPGGAPGFGGISFHDSPELKPFESAPIGNPKWNAQAQFGGPGALPPLGGNQGGFPGGGFPGGGGGFPGGEGGPGVALPASQQTNIKELRVTFVRETGTMTGRIPINLDRTQPDDGGWRLFVLPIKEMRQTRGASGPIKRVVMTGDKEDTVFIAQAALVIETGQMTVSVRPRNEPEGTQTAEITVKPGPFTLVADVEAGAADPQIEWNFDADNIGLPRAVPPGVPLGAPNGFPGAPVPGGFPGAVPGGEGGQPGIIGEGMVAPDLGPRVDARGLVATFTYPNEEQNYRVEVTVRDKSGQKQPVTASVIVRVRA